MRIILAISIFIISYLLIVSERITKATAALSGAMALVVFHILSQDEAFAYIDFHTVGLLLGMMIIVNIIKETGLFRYLAIKTAKWAKGNPTKILIIFGLITVVGSAFLDNVTTVLLIAPVTLVICETLKINPIPFLVTEIIMSNIGGTATMIGDPPNIMIGTSTGLSFMSFFVNLSPIILIIIAIVLTIMVFVYRQDLQVNKNTRAMISQFNEKSAIKDKKLLYQSLFVLGLVILVFLLHDIIKVDTSTIALSGAALLLLISDVYPEHVLKEVEWSTLIFFAGLFILVGGLEKVGIIEWLAQHTLNFTKGHFVLTTIFLLWVSAFASSVIDNIPFVATMIPLIKAIGYSAGPDFDIQPLWWALSLGACLGGNGSLVGASANLVVAGIAEKSKYKIGFVSFLRIGLPIMILTIIISTIYIYLRYLI